MSPARIVATFFGVGRFPFASGTAGSLAALPLAYIGAVNWSVGLGIIGVLLLVGIPSATVVAREEGAEDPGIIVIDEVIGMMIAALAIGPSLWALFCAFLLFRLFDILKPWPCRRLEDLPGGWGVTLDDIGAGIYSAGVMAALKAVGVL